MKCPGLTRSSHHGGADISVCPTKRGKQGRQECLPHRIHCCLFPLCGEKCGLTVVIVVVLLSGCTPASKPSGPTSEAPPFDAKKPPSITAESPAAKQPAHRVRDDFNLPLMIHMEVPETPPEIEKPSVPIKEASPEPRNPLRPIQEKPLMR